MTIEMMRICLESVGEWTRRVVDVERVGHWLP